MTGINPKKRKENVNNASLISFWGTEEQKKKNEIKKVKTINDFWVKKDDSDGKAGQKEQKHKDKKEENKSKKDDKMIIEKEDKMHNGNDDDDDDDVDNINNDEVVKDKKDNNKKVKSKKNKKEETTKSSSYSKDIKTNNVVKNDTSSTKSQSKRDILVSMWKDKKKNEEEENNEDNLNEKQTINDLKKEKNNSNIKDKDNNPKGKDINKGDDAPMPYLTITSTFEKIEAITSRLEIQDLLTTLYRHSLDNNPSDMYHLLYLTSNTVAPAYECVELGVGDAVLMKALGEAAGTDVKMIKARYEKEGDLGKVAQFVKGRQRTLGFGAKPKPLLANEVLDILRQIAKTSGAKSQKWKVDKIKGLLVRAQSIEAKYILRALQGRLRIGLSESTVLISLGHALFLSPPVDSESKVEDTEQAVKIIRKAYAEVPSYDLLLKAALSVPLDDIPTLCSLQPGCPVSPMLAKPTKSILEVLKRLNGLRFTCEYKYDGERAQVHMKTDDNGKEITNVFSRNLLETTEKYSEVPQYVKEACKDNDITSFVLDTEVVAFNRETQLFVPFQVLSTRKKKLDDNELQEDKDIKVQIIVQAFDLMYVNGESLLNKSLYERRALMHKYFKPIEGKFAFATYIDHKEDGDTLKIEEFLDKAVKGQCEGLMVKTLDENATYEPSKRSLNWLKLKKDYLEGLGDSVDLVVLGAYHGRGKRTGVYGAYLLACYDYDTEEFQSTCKIGTGFSDEDLKDLSEALNKHIIPNKSSQYNVSDSLECDVWFDAVQVWEIKAADLSKSSTHKGAINKTGEAGRGIGLRFPRFERVREDKKPEDATSSDQILDMYYAQDSVTGGNDGGGADYDEL